MAFPPHERSDALDGFDRGTWDGRTSLGCSIREHGSRGKISVKFPFFLEHPNPKLRRLKLPFLENIPFQFGHVWELVHEHLKRGRDLIQALICNTIRDQETQEAEKAEELQNAHISVFSRSVKIV